MPAGKPKLSRAPADPIGNYTAKYEATNVVERAMVARFLATIRDRVPQAGSTLVEVGAGEGHIINQVRPIMRPDVAVGIDLVSGELRRAWADRGVVGLFADGHELPIHTNSADLVLALEVLEHVAVPQVVLREIGRIARGTVLLSVPWEPVWRAGNLVRGRYVADLGNTPGHVNHWTRRAFVRLVATELEVVDVMTRVPWTIVVARAR